MRRSPLLLLVGQLALLGRRGVLLGSLRVGRRRRVLWRRTPRLSATPRGVLVAAVLRSSSSTCILARSRLRRVSSVKVIFNGWPMHSHFQHHEDDRPCVDSNSGCQAAPSGGGGGDGAGHRRVVGLGTPSGCLSTRQLDEWAPQRLLRNDDGVRIPSVGTPDTAINAAVGSLQGG